MTQHQLERSKEIDAKRFAIQQELEIWNHKFVTKWQVAYIPVGKEFGTRIKTQMSDAIFKGFRATVIADLEQQLTELDRVFAEI